MKLYLICFLIIMLLIGLCVFSIQFLSDMITYTCTIIRDATELYKAGEANTALQLITNAEDRWKQNETTLGALLSHSELEAVVSDFAELKARIQCDDSDDYEATASTLLLQLEHILEMEYPLLQNIL